MNGTPLIRRSTAPCLLAATLGFLAALLTVQPLSAQPSTGFHGPPGHSQDVTYAPLPLFVSGSGTVFPLEDGQMLEVGRTYFMVAIPDQGYVLSAWQEVNVFTFIEYTKDGSGNVVERTSTVVAPIDEYIHHPALRFIMQPQVMLFDVPGVRSVSESIGWQATFVPRNPSGRTPKS